MKKIKPILENYDALKKVRKQVPPPSKIFGGSPKENNKRNRKKIKNDIKNEKW